MDRPDIEGIRERCVSGAARPQIETVMALLAYIEALEKAIKILGPNGGCVCPENHWNKCPEELILSGG